MDNLHMTASGNMVSVGWDQGGARFHVWLEVDRDAKRPHHLPGLPVKPYRLRNATLYKNPPLGTKYKGPDYFKTRHLDPTSKANADTVAKALVAAELAGLYDVALAAAAAAEAERVETANREAELAMRSALVTEANTLDEQGHLAAKEGADAIRRYLLKADRDSLLRLRRLLLNGGR